MRLISLDVLNKYPIRRHRCDKKNANPHFINGIESVLEYANELPVVEERKHGYWIEHPEHPIGDCSVCGERVPIYTYNIHGGSKKYKICPYCGAIMDGDSK